MKKLFSILFLAAIAMSASAQYTTPRFGTGTRDNTFRSMTLGYTTWTDAVGADSTTLTPSKFDMTYRVALVDSFYVKSPTVTYCYAGDRMTIIASGASGTKLKFAGTNFITAGTATLSTSGRSIITLVFDGAKWVERSRVTQ